MKNIFRSSSILLFCAAFLLIFTSCEKTIVINGVSQHEANEILVYLASKGIQATKVQAATGSNSKTLAYNIQVDAAEAMDALAYLNKDGFPKKKTVTLLEIFSKQGLVPSEMEEKIRFRSGKEEEIASIIRKIDGVLDANLQLSYPEENALGETKKNERPSAAVYVKHQGVLDDPNSHLITKIKRLVASSINGLSYEDVTVVSDRARFADITLPGEHINGETQEKDYVKIWSLTITKDSLTRFRLIFFTLCFFTLFFLLVTAWLIWKLLPTFSKGEGGYKQLFMPKPFPVPEKVEEDRDDDDEGDEDEYDDEGDYDDEEEDK